MGSMLSTLSTLNTNSSLFLHRVDQALALSHFPMKVLSEGSSPILENDPATSDSVTAAMLAAVRLLSHTPCFAPPD